MDTGDAVDTGDNHICRDIAPVDPALCAVMGIVRLQLVKMLATVLPMLTLAQQAASPNIGQFKVSSIRHSTGQPRPGPRSECPIVIYRHLSPPRLTYWAGAGAGHQKCYVQEKKWRD